MSQVVSLLEFVNKRAGREKQLRYFSSPDKPDIECEVVGLREEARERGNGRILANFHVYVRNLGDVAGSGWSVQVKAPSFYLAEQGAMLAVVKEHGVDIDLLHAEAFLTDRG